VGVWGNQPEPTLCASISTHSPVSPTSRPVRVLPSHDRVFEGLHPRIIELARTMRSAWRSSPRPAKARSPAFDVLPVLFRRKLDEHQLGFAMGEAIAHLHYLQAEAGSGGSRKAACADTFAARPVSDTLRCQKPSVSDTRPANSERCLTPKGF